MEVINRSGGLLRQFILDDKGMVCIWTFGLPNNSFEDNGHRGLSSCLDVARALAEQELRTQIGITSGTAFCGCVGAAYRSEYSVMGPAVNLAARLMCACEKHCEQPRATLRTDGRSPSHTARRLPLQPQPPKAQSVPPPPNSLTDRGPAVCPTACASDARTSTARGGRSGRAAVQRRAVPRGARVISRVCVHAFRPGAGQGL
eukprot:1041585-Prymnesium_polylepis.1